MAGELAPEGSRQEEPAAPRAVILVTGTELTRGETRDLNGPFLGTELTLLGARVERITLLPDDPRVLAAGLRAALSEAEVVVASGGLGPTADDHTVQVVAAVFGRGIYRHPEALARMKARALARLKSESEIPPNYFKQAEVVEGAEVLLNPAGLAPGMLLEGERGCLVVLPGVPREMQALFREEVAPRLSRRFQLHAPRIIRAKIVGLGESWAEARIQKLGIDFGRVEYGISAAPGELLVKFAAHRPRDHGYVDRVRALLEAEFGDDLLLLPEGLKTEAGEPSEVEHARLVHEVLLSSGATVAIAESLTGGLVAKRLCDHAGASGYFLGGIVAYADRAKVELLEVPAELLRAHGAVSESVCAAMARSARRLFGADFGLSTTGIAGPGGGSETKPVGLVYIGLAAGERGGAGARSEAAGEVVVERHHFWGNRRNVRALAAVRALEMLRRRLKKTWRPTP